MRSYGQRIQVRKGLEAIPAGEALVRVPKPLCCLLYRPSGLPNEPTQHCALRAYFSADEERARFPFLNP